VPEKADRDEVAEMKTDRYTKSDVLGNESRQEKKDWGTRQQAQI
jgi:hypothetical protein